MKKSFFILMRKKIKKDDYSLNKFLIYSFIVDISSYNNFIKESFKTKLIGIILAGSLIINSISCSKDEEVIPGCGCGYITKAWQVETEGDWLKGGWRYIWKDECSGEEKTLWTVKDNKEPWVVGQRLCILHELTPEELDSLSCTGH